MTKTMGILLTTLLFCVQGIAAAENAVQPLDDLEATEERFATVEVLTDHGEFDYHLDNTGECDVSMALQEVFDRVADFEDASATFSFLPGAYFSDARFTDGGCVTMPVGSFKQNALGIYDMHGNACEWTLSDYGPGEKIVKGGSWFDRPARAHVDIQRGYALWQNVFNVGFRIVVNE